MTDTLATFADQVTTVAREVGVEGQARRPGERAGRGRHVEGPHRQREPARREPDDAGARDRRRRDGRDEGRPHAVDPGRRARRSGRVEGQHQRDDPQPEGHDAQERRAGLAEDQPREVLAHAPGPEGPAHGRPADPLRARAGRDRAARRVLHLDAAREDDARGRVHAPVPRELRVHGRPQTRGSGSARGSSASARSRRRRSS